MKFDKVTIVGFAVCVLLLLAWEPICRHLGWISPPRPRTAVTAPAGKPAAAATATDMAGEPASSGEKSPTPAPAPQPEFLKLAPVVLKNSASTVVVDPNDGIVREIRLNNFLNNDRKTPVTFRCYPAQHILSFRDGATWRTVKVAVVGNDDSALTVDRVVRRGDREVAITQNWKLEENFQLHYTFTLKNSDRRPLPLERVALETGALSPLIHQTGESVRNEVFNVDYFSTKLVSVAVKPGEKAFNQPLTLPVRWLGVSNKYFACLLKPAGKTGTFVGIEPLLQQHTDATGKDFITASAAGLLPNTTLAPGGQATFSYS
ncbi:MAG: hypothetical protein PHQ27_06645, partial [Victivallales bacterium]|nr:hypothetical protein [Victivallales bacterium]